MKKFFAAIFMSLALVLTGLAAAPVASAAPEKVSIGSFKDAVFVTKVSPEQRNIGGGVIRPLYYWLPPEYCYWSGLTQRNYYCYRYGCTYFERIAWGCYDGYVRIQTVYWA